jgi:hypothetical protein
MSSFHFEGAFNSADGAFFFYNKAMRTNIASGGASRYSLSLRQLGASRQTL